MKRTSLNIYEYTDFRAFLKDRLTELKASDSRYSLRFLSDRLGLSSKSHLKMVADGQRNLSSALAGKIGAAIGLADEEAAFFVALVRYGQAKSTVEQQTALDELRRRRKFLDVHQLELDHFDYLSDQLTLTLRELVSFPDFKEDPNWIAERMPIEAPPRQIKEAISKLLRLGLVRRDEKGSLIPSHIHQVTGDGLKSVALRTFYEQTFARAAASMLEPSAVRHLGGLTMAISEDSYHKIIDRYKSFVAEVRHIVDDDISPDQVYQLVMGLFPLTKADYGDRSAEKKRAAGGSK